MGEDFRCIPYIDGVVHGPHNYTPDDHDETYHCDGIRDTYGTLHGSEKRVAVEYRLAMWVNYSGVKELHKTRAAIDLDEARKWLVEYEEDFASGKWFIIRDTIVTQSKVIS